jgi:hypothetical protein
MSRKKTYTLIATMLSLSISSTTEPVLCASKNFRTLQLIALKEMREAVIAAQKADDIMLQEIDIVARDLKVALSQRMRTRSQKDPLALSRAESASLATRLGRLVAENPYSDNPIFKGPSTHLESVSEEDIFAGATANNSLKSVVKQANQKPITNVQNQSVSTKDLQSVLSQQRQLPGGTRVVQTGSPMTSPYAALTGKTAAESGSASLEQPLQNPSSPFKPVLMETGAPPHSVRIKITTDPTVSFTQANQWRNKMPDDWKDKPGTIHIVHNGYDSALIWGAGVEGKPVFDREKRRFKVVALRLGRQ